MVMRLGKSRYASGPATKSTMRSDSSSCVLRRSAMHPNTPTMRGCDGGRRRFIARSSLRRCHTLASALSRMAHVFTNAASASCTAATVSYPACCSTASSTCVSATFIWQPWVSMNTRRRPRPPSRRNA